MDWSDIKDAVGNIAPVLGTALGGPAGGAVGSLVASALGTEAKPNAVQEAMKSDPQAAVKLREVEAKHLERLEELALEEAKAHLQDRQSAREREVALQRAGRTSWEMIVLAGLAVGGLILVAVVLFVKEVPPGAEEMLLMIVGALISRAGDVYAFYFGSSRGSKEKDGVLAQLRK